MQHNLFTEAEITTSSPAIAKPFVSRSTFYMGDCLVEMDKIADKSVDMILCDLPYETTWAKWDKKISANNLWLQYNRIIKNNCPVVLFSSQPFTTQIISSNIDNYKYTWYWVKDNKGNYLNAKRQPLRQLEEINVFYKHNYYPQGLIDLKKQVSKGNRAATTMLNYSSDYYQEKTGYPSNVIYYGLDRDNIHPTQKPVSLMEYLIKTYTNEGETVLDNCMGSGTTGVACKKTNRHFIGIEKDEGYYHAAVSRVSAYCG